MKKIVLFLTDPMTTYYEKGEIKDRYYNPENFFDEVHMISFCDEDIGPEDVRIVAGEGRLYIHAVGKPRFFNLISILRKIFDVIKKVAPQVIRAYDPSFRGAAAVLCGKKFKVPTVISLHADLDEQRIFRKDLKFKIRRLLELYSLANVNKVICVSEYLVPYAKRYGAKDIAVIYNRVDTYKFRNDRNKKTHDVKEILCVARLDSQKYQECIIRAIKDLDMNLTLVGTGEMEGHLKNLVDQLGIPDKVIFIKSVMNSNMPSQYSKSDIFAIATHYEGFCIPIIEAMAAGIPVVASDIPPIREVLNGAGILVANNAALFRNAFTRLKEDVGLYKNLSENGRKRALIFNSNGIEAKEKDLYQSLIDGLTHGSSQDITCGYNFVDVRCDICGSADYKYIGKRHAAGLTASVVRCKDCGLFYPNPFPMPAESITEKNYNNRKGYFNEGLKKHKRYNYAAILKRLENNFKSKGRLLDVGCGEGDLLEEAGLRGWDCVGIDISKEFVDYARSRGLNAVTGKFDEMNFPSGHFDVVTMYALLEHVTSPKRYLMTARRVLKDKGVLYLKVPNEGSVIFTVGDLYNRMKTSSETTHLSIFKPPFHLYGFSLRTLVRTFETTGFKVLFIRAFNDGPSGFTRDRTVLEKAEKIGYAAIHELCGRIGQGISIEAYVAKR